MPMHQLRQAGNQSLGEARQGPHRAHRGVGGHRLPGEQASQCHVLPSAWRKRHSPRAWRHLATCGMGEDNPGRPAIQSSRSTGRADSVLIVVRTLRMNHDRNDLVRRDVHAVGYAGVGAACRSGLGSGSAGGGDV